MNQEIVEKIKRLRISKGYSHNDMADKLHITRSAYQRLESGEVLHQENKEMYRELMKSKDDQIELLKKMLEQKI